MEGAGQGTATTTTTNKDSGPILRAKRKKAARIHSIASARPRCLTASFIPSRWQRGRSDPLTVLLFSASIYAVSVAVKSSDSTPLVSSVSFDPCIGPARMCYFMDRTIDTRVQEEINTTRLRARHAFQSSPTLLPRIGWAWCVTSRLPQNDETRLVCRRPLNWPALRKHTHTQLMKVTFQLESGDALKEHKDYEDRNYANVSGLAATTRRRVVETQAGVV